MKKEKITIKNIYYVIQGYIRYYLYYWKSNYNYTNRFVKWIFLLPLHKLISTHIREQITIRINSMKKECYNNGSCTECGCRTTHLQMANKKCLGDCYPAMQSKKNWNLLKNKKIVISDSRAWQLRNNKFKKYEVGKKSN